jgi:hypothetical protein
MSVAHVHSVSKEDLEARRREVLARLNMTYEELADRAKKHSLVGDEWTAWDEMREIDFLMAGD